MADNTATLYSYTVNCEGNSARLEYVQPNGTAIVSLFGIIGEDGQWQEFLGSTTLTIAKHGDTGCLLTLFGEPFSPDPSMGGTDFTLTLVFNTQVDWTKPLPLDEFSTDGSVYTVHSWSIDGYDDKQNYAVTSLTLNPPQTGTDY